MTSRSDRPSRTFLVGVSLDVRTYAEGDRVFDELEVALTRGANEDKWHLIQLMRQVDTVCCPAQIAKPA